MGVIQSHQRKAASSLMRDSCNHCCVRCKSLISRCNASSRMPRTAGSPTQMATLSRNFSCKWGNTLGKSKNAFGLAEAKREEVSRSLGALETWLTESCSSLLDIGRGSASELCAGEPSKRSNSDATMSRCDCSCAKNVGTSANPKASAINPKSSALVGSAWVCWSSKYWIRCSTRLKNT